MATPTLGILDNIFTLGDIARVYGRLRSNTFAMKFEDRETNYSLFDTHTNRVAHALKNAGATKGSRIGYLAKNTDQFFEILIGGAKMGSVLLPIGWEC